VMGSKRNIDVVRISLAVRTAASSLSRQLSTRQPLSRLQAGGTTGSSSAEGYCAPV
jgi:hypothetical protein